MVGQEQDKERKSSRVQDQELPQVETCHAEPGEKKEQLCLGRNLGA